MGNNNKSSNQNCNYELINRNNFKFISIIGQGGFGKVWKVELKKTNQEYAMKEISKLKIIDKNSEKNIKSERNLLSKMCHPFIITMHYSFQDNENLYLILDLLSGGDLRYHINKKIKFTEEQAKFIIGCTILGLEYCHKNYIIHRDIKPENLLLDENGYIKISDFGIAKIQIENNKNETSGTPGYMAPEVLFCQNHTIVVDYFALGIICYELMKNIRPYIGKSKKEIKEKMMNTQIYIKKNDICKNWSLESIDFINGLLQRKPFKRLGFHGINEIKNHSWFDNFDWDDLYNKKIIAPFIPKNIDNFDTRFFNQIEKIGVDTKERYNKILNDSNFNNIFSDFYYFDIDIAKNNKNYKMFINPHEINFENYYTNRFSRNQDNLRIYQTTINKKRNNSFRHYYTNNYNSKLIDFENENKKNKKLKKVPKIKHFRTNSAINTTSSFSSAMKSNSNCSIKKHYK